MIAETLPPLPIVVPISGLTAFGCVLVIASIAVCLGLNMDPGADGFGFVDNQIVKYAPSICLGVAALSFLLTGASRRILGSRSFLFAFALVSLQIVGAFWTFQAHQADAAGTFLGRGIAASAIFAGLMVGHDPRLASAVLRPLARMAVLCAWCSIVIAVAHGMRLVFVDLPQVFHEELLYVAAGLMLWSARRPLPLLGPVALALLVFVAVVSGKATAQLMALVFLLAVFFLPPFLVAVERMRRRDQASPLIGYVLIVVTVAVALFMLYFVIGLVEAKDLARPNDLRKMLWALRWGQFLDSPIFGSFFVGSPIVYVPMLPGVQIPTHNDFLDMLGFGGLAGFGLFAALLLPIACSRVFWDAFRFPRPRSYQDYPAYVMIAYAAVAAANPVFSSPFLSVPVWFAIGVLNGMLVEQRARRAKNG